MPIERKNEINTYLIWEKAMSFGAKIAVPKMNKLGTQAWSTLKNKTKKKKKNSHTFFFLLQIANGRESKKTTLLYLQQYMVYCTQQQQYDPYDDGRATTTFVVGLFPNVWSSGRAPLPWFGGGRRRIEVETTCF